ncbi:MAG: hypothetical protein GKS06_07910 [Acidobacteria bacterium]|nr:hypothetical protein [Acidobacteriota bacterium]
MTARQIGAAGLLVAAVPFFAGAASSEQLPVAKEVEPFAASAPARLQAEPIQLELVVSIGGSTEDPDQVLHWVSTQGGLAVTPDGALFVLDIGRKTVHSFSPDGQLLRRFGEGGEGPGDLKSPTAISMLGHDIVVVDSRPLRLHRWRPNGKFVSSTTLETEWTATDRVLRLSETLDGNLLAHMSYVPRTPDDPRATTPAHGQRLVVFAPSGEQIAEIRRDERHVPLTLFKPARPDGNVIRGRALRRSFLGFAIPRWEVSESGRVCGSVDESYEVICIDAQGQHELTLVAQDWQAPAVTPAERDEEAAFLRDADTEAFLEADLPWPTHHEALSRNVLPVVFDSAGRIYVFPTVGPDAAAVPVDVYSPAGELLYSGTVEGAVGEVGGWIASQGEYVYSVTREPNLGEYQVVKYRLKLPY